jgi:hypothetical protein
MVTTSEKIELLMRLEPKSQADWEYLQREIPAEIERALAEGRIRDSLRLKQKLLALNQSQSSCVTVTQDEEP